MSRTTPTYREGIGWRNETRHRQTRRHRSHDYSGVGTYLVTMTVTGRAKVFGYVDGDLRAAKGTPAYAHLVATPLAERILTEEVRKIHHYYPMVEVWKIVLMPDHLHMIVRVASAMPPGKNLGQVIRGFKTGCCRAWWQLTEEQPSDKADGTGAPDTAPGAVAPGAGAVGSAAPVSSAFPEDKRPPVDRRRPLLFEPGYNDHILMNAGQLDSWRGYLDENPFRLLVRQRMPDIMQRALRITLNGRHYSAFGNFMLLKVPEKRQVMCHRMATIGMLTDEERRQHGYTYAATADMKTTIPYEHTTAFGHERAAVIEAAWEGVVIVTPGISKGEQIIKHACLEKRLPLIHLQQEPITALWKPEKERFHACAAGRLLILAPWPDDLEGSSSYERFHNLNGLAAELCAMEVEKASYGCTAVGQKPTAQGPPQG